MKALDELLGIGNKIIDRLWPDPVKKEEAKLKLAEMHQTGELAQLQADTSLALGQIAINTEEAKSDNWFVAGWRPFVGWICGLTLFYAALFEPLLR
ncbi:MAG: 3TM-type holin, partial [bacterium]